MRPASLLLFAACSAAVPEAQPGGAGESCASPLFVTLPLTLHGTTQGFADDDGNALSDCGGGGAPDVFIAFTATAGQLVTATLTAQGFTASLKLRSAARGCRDLDQACATLPGTVSLVDQPVSIGGTHTLIVDSNAGGAGTFDLEVSAR